MKAWRDSASLLLAARHGQKYSRTVAATTRVVDRVDRSSKQNCRVHCLHLESGAGAEPSPERTRLNADRDAVRFLRFQHNYNLLCLKRHKKSTFMPSSYVFPGGVLDPADTDVKWRKLYAGLGFDGGSLACLIPRSIATRPQIFRAEQNEQLPREISLRITAIRETFEESGVLICRRRRDADEVDISVWAQHMPMPQDELQTWQSKIHDDATLFYELCEKLQCCPDLWALHEWSNWLTPTTITSRYDTIFYLACMPSKPNANYEVNEMEGLKWETPENFMVDSTTLPPPQKYLITQLIGLRDIGSLLNSAVEHGEAGVQMYLPISVQLKDGAAMVLPGDTTYPKEINLLERQIIDKSDITIAEYREMTPFRNRFEICDEKSQVVMSDNLPGKVTEDHFTKRTRQGEDMKNKL